ncbi:MAG: DUF2279 domain-containing protein [Brumimicrobium sp.]|nr:DUF2279 domain-containing protein [Brumimicrobium sp.]MCO5268088.1 YfiM family protein [Brumimicrobium sp.]
MNRDFFISYLYPVKNILLILLLFSFSVGNAQKFFENDTVFNKKRTIWVSSVVGTGWVGSIVGLQGVWYKDSWSNKMHIFNDSKEWRGMDKMGHAFTGNMIAKNMSALYRWSGLTRNQSLLIGSSISFGYMATLEILDGFSTNWGFSWSDIGANSLGIAWNVWQELAWQEERIKLKFSAHLSPYAKYRQEVLGSTFMQRILKDYNGQTYWLSISPGSFLSSSSRFPKWISFSFGYSIDQKLHGQADIYTYYSDNAPPKTFYAQSQFLFSLDIDFEKIPTKKKWLHVIFKAINHVKMPFPAMIVTGKSVKVHPFYF